MWTSAKFYVVCITLFELRYDAHSNAVSGLASSFWSVVRRMNEFQEDANTRQFTVTVIAQALVKSQVLCTTCNSNWIAFGFYASSLSPHNVCWICCCTDHVQILMLQTTTFRRNVEHQLMFYGAIARNTCTVPLLTVILCGKLWVLE
jgi:hypothetical protein